VLQKKEIHVSYDAKLRMACKDTTKIAYTQEKVQILMKNSRTLAYSKKKHYLCARFRKTHRINK